MKTPNLISLSWRLAIVGAAPLLLPLTGNAGPMEKNPVVENLQRPFDWSGFYIGANIGGALSEYEFRGSGSDSDGHLFTDVDIGQQFLGQDAAGLDVVRFFDRIDKDRPDREELRGSILGGGQIGYQRQFGHFVFGVEGDFDRTSMRSLQKFQDAAFTELLGPPGMAPSGTTTTITADTEFRGQREAQTNWVGSARGKFGYATGPLLFYGTAGVAFAQVDVWAHDVANSLFTITTVDDDLVSRRPPVLPSGDSSTFSFNLANTDVDKDDDVMVGWTAGAGLEVAFTDAASLALEYRHNGFGDETFHFNSHGAHAGPIFPGGTNVNFDSDEVTVKLNILLGHFFGHSSDMASTASPATNNVAVKSPFGSNGESVQVGYTKAKDADKWSAKDKEVAVVEEFNWTGFYIGANVGGAWTDYDFGGFNADVDVADQFFANLSSRPAADAPSAPTGGEFTDFALFEVPGIDGGSDDSLIGGGQFGYQYQWHHFVFGIEGDFSGLSSAKSTQYASTGFGIFNDKGLVEGISTLTTIRKATTDWIATARARFGYARGPLMLYVTGGGAWANVRTWASDQVVTDFLFISPDAGGTSAPSGVPGFVARSINNTNDEDTIGGWTAGGGAEWAFSKIATLGVEYRHNEFDNADSHYDPHHSPIFAQGNSVDINTDQVTVKVNLLLGHMGPGH